MMRNVRAARSVMLSLLLVCPPAVVAQDAPAKVSGKAPARAPITAVQAKKTSDMRVVLPPPAPPNPAIWRVADADTTIHLFGTIHVLDPALDWRSPRLAAVIAQADALVVEATDADAEAQDAAIERIVRADLTVSRPPFLDRVPAVARPAMRTAIEAAGVPATAFDAMPNWMAMVMLEMGGALSGGATSEAGADSSLEREFRAAGKPVTSIEDPVAVLQSIRGVPEADLMTMMVASVMPAAAADDAASDAPRDSDERAWAAGRIERMGEGLDEATLGRVLYDVLIRRRNAAWTRWIADRLARPGRVLVAVGAGHLVGPDSLQTMLAARGITALRVDR